MKTLRPYLLLSFVLISQNVLAQTPSKKIERVFEKYASVRENPPDAHTDSLVLVRFKRALNPAELAVVKPKRQLSLTHFVVNKSALKALSAEVSDQVRANSLWKATDLLSQQMEQTPGKTLTVRIVLKDMQNGIPVFLQDYNPQLDQGKQFIAIQITGKALKTLLQREEISFADVAQTAKTELNISDADPAVNGITAVRANLPGIDGTGMTLSLKEDLFNTDDPDLLGKYLPGSVVSSRVTDHATTMATLATGSGNTSIRGLGVAPFAKITSSDFNKRTSGGDVNDRLFPDAPDSFKSLNVNVQNHSYGTSIENMYGMEAAAYDKQVFENDNLIHVFSAGNIGTTTPTAGVYKDILNRANLTGNFKQAKNILVIGGINREDLSEILSSKGPAYDGRVKPDMVALGEDGTSGAAALSSGIVTIFEQQYQKLYQKAPSSALARSILINSAEDLGTPQVDYVYGFGKINAFRALNTLLENRFRSATVSTGQDYTFPITVPAGQQEVKVTLVWNDPPAALNSAQSIVNHLDLSLETPSGQIVLPWVLNPYPHLDSLSKQAVRGIDNLNTVQQVTLENLIPGNYTIHVKGRSIQQATQDFSIAYELTPANAFSWNYPDNADQLFATENNYVRWSSTLNTQSGKLSASFDGGVNWTVLNEMVDVRNRFYKWPVGDLFTKAQLKMEAGGQTYTGKPFVISKPMIIKVGYNCNDAVMVHWAPQPGAVSYTLYHIKDNKLVPLKQVTDTMAIIKKTELSTNYLSLAANGNGFTGLKAYLTDFTIQGVTCYTRTFNGDIDGNKIILSLSLGSTYNLKKLTWEKQTGINTFITLGTDQIIQGQFNYTHTDLNPQIGAQRYRVTYETLDGQQLQSEIITINFLKDNDFVFFPNPVDNNINLVTGSFDQNYYFELYNVIGQKVFASTSVNGNQQFDLSRLAPGMYIGIISRSGKTLKKLKVIKK